MTEQERLMTLADARAVMAAAGETLSKVSAFLATTAAAPDWRAHLAAVLPYAQSRAEDMDSEQANAKPFSPESHALACKAVAAVDDARAALDGVPSAPAVPQPMDEARDIIYRLIEWADFTGGWEAPIWDRARAFFLRTRQNPESDQPSEPAPEMPWQLVYDPIDDDWAIVDDTGTTLEVTDDLELGMRIIVDVNGKKPFLVVRNPDDVRRA